MISSRLKAELALCFATIVWGLTFPFIRIVLRDIDPSMLVFLRGAAAAFVLAWFVLSNEYHRKTILRLLPLGFGLGALSYLSYYTQTIGLQTISSGRSAFLTNLSVAFVPFLSPLFRTGRISAKDIASSGLALVGMLFLTNPFQQSGMTIGDFWTIICALSFSVQIQLMHVSMRRYPHSSVSFAFLQLFFLTVCSSFLLPFVPHQNLFHLSLSSVLALAYLSAVAMVLTTWIQANYQHQTTPERASLIYILEPVFASCFGFLILNETMSLSSLFGGLLMILAVVWHSFWKILKKAL